MKKRPSLFLFLLLVTLGSQATAQTPELDRLKAIFILNFIKFSDHQAANGAGEFVVGVYQDENMQQELSKICANSYHGKRVVVKSITDLSSPVHLLFVPERKNFNYLAYIKKNGSIPHTMVVADTDIRYSAISFQIENNQLHFRLNDEVLFSNSIKLAAPIREIAINNSN